jgi:hypothetical protein
LQEKFSQIFSYAAQHAADVHDGPDFMDDAIRIERYLEDFSTRLGQASKATSTRGAISVHINSNEHTDSNRDQNWIDFDAQWWGHAVCCIIAELRTLFENKIRPPKSASMLTTAWQPCASHATAV